ncbi:PilZ domain-containing protein [Novosphingobium sp. AP12]|uniref:PilZ domain-containing protein n=1 Tax=Novosphingobium sp. AP12 TaxID=1144305 RepID=UPI0012FA912A|nr:PilZ domain-containing protein [Novosphingobium sp. AP12]
MDARNWSRHLVDKDVPCSVAGVEGRGFLYDLSAGGCMVELGDARDVIGSSVAIDLYGSVTTVGTVIWQSSHYVGVRFEVPLHDAVVRHVGFTPPEIPFEEQLHRDRFGRVLPPLESAGRRRYGDGSAGAAL